jgi:hypothetical protein
MLLVQNALSSKHIEFKMLLVQNALNLNRFEFKMLLVRNVTSLLMGGNISSTPNRLIFELLTLQDMSPVRLVLKK